MVDRPVDGQAGFSFRTYREHRVRLKLHREAAGRAEVDLVFPPPTGGRIVVETSRSSRGRPGELCIDGFAGPGAEYPYLDVRHSGDRDGLEPTRKANTGHPPRDGARVRVENYHEVLSGSGPYRVVLPTGAILLDVEAEGNCGPPSIYVDGRMWHWEAESGEGPWLVRSGASAWASTD